MRKIILEMAAGLRCFKSSLEGQIPMGLRIFLSLLLFLQYSGCTLIGGGIGSLADSSKPKTRSISGREIATVKRGTRVDLVLKSGDSLSGKFLGLERRSATEYAQAYANARDQKLEGLLLPALGESVAVMYRMGNTIRGELLGFEHQEIVLWGNDGGEIIRAIPERGTISSREGTDLPGKLVIQSIVEGQVPLLSQIVLERSGKTLKEDKKTFFAETTRVALDQVAQTQIHPKHHGKRTGAIIGAVFDVAIIALAVGLAIGGISTWSPSADGDGATHDKQEE